MYSMYRFNHLFFVVMLFKKKWDIVYNKSHLGGSRWQAYTRDSKRQPQQAGRFHRGWKFMKLVHLYCFSLSFFHSSCLRITHGDINFARKQVATLDRRLSYSLDRIASSLVLRLVHSITSIVLSFCWIRKKKKWAQTSCLMPNNNIDLLTPPWLFQVLYAAKLW